MRVRYSLHGVRFSIHADDRLAAHISETIMPACVRRGRRADTAAGFVVRSEGGRLSVFRGRRRLWAADSAAELIPWLEFEVVDWLLARLGRYVQLHAAVVQRGGRAIVLAGGPDAGKTSMACALGLAGWGVMGDEVALVEPRGSRVLSFPRAMLVESGTVRRLPELRRVEPRRVELDRGPASVRYVNPASVGGKVRDRARICAVAFPEWSKKGSVSAVGEREALERLLCASMNGGRHPRLSVDTCVGLVRNAARLRVRTARLRESARRLSDAVEELR